jgi:transcriptional regulator with XRE-family HTH domain
MFDVGSRIQKLRKLHKITSSELASKINISQPQLSRLENNLNLAQLDTIYDICKVLNISLSEFFSPSEDTLSKDLNDILNAAKDLNQEDLSLVLKIINRFKYPQRS